MPIPKNYTPQVRLSAKEKAFHQLQRWIVDGTLEPGEKVTDADLAEALGVSRTPVREALQLLESQGFVEMKPGKETKITLIHPDDALAVYPPLAHLQALAAELAAPLLTEEEIAELKNSRLNTKPRLRKSGTTMQPNWTNSSTIDYRSG